MDEAHISRAVVLSTAYSLANPHKAPVPQEHQAVRRENDWTADQVARHSDRLVGFCSVNPLRPYAVSEINRCAKNPNLHTRVKLHFGNSDVDVNNPAHLAQMKKVFRAANRNRMALLIHAHANVNFKRPYGAREARVFVEQLLPDAPDVVVVLAHMAGAGAFESTTQEAAAVYAEALARQDPRVRNLFFDACVSASETEAPLLAQFIRRVGVSRVFYGSDAPVTGNLPLNALERWHKFPLTSEEFRTIESNVAPFLSAR